MPKKDKKNHQRWSKKTAVIAFGKYRWERIKDTRGGEKCKPTNRSNSNHGKIENKKMVGMVGKQRDYLKKVKESEEFFNHVGLSRLNN